ncbi:SDR family NAD(P)-dependent oxidoreductase [Burkholderia ambifaria]|uniref:SDR family NAD(P)-dependent oxidoreductase n=1 Tax=Burkholderia ambifaria TaxID=152480 RepID=UPI0028F44E0C|nr:SDR family NAD(P)-dependent oxidoreductase [Burkholderia ambifaria]
MFGLNVLMQRILPGMRQRRRGHVFNMSSLAGLVAFAATGYYHAAKFAVEALSGSQSHEVAPLGIRVAIVEPGAFRTDWAGRSMVESAIRTARRAPERFHEPPGSGPLRRVPNATD